MEDKKRQKPKGSRRTERARGGATSGHSPVEPSAASGSPSFDRDLGDRFSRVVAPPELYDAKKRAEWGLEDEDGRGPYIIELNLQHLGGLPGAAAALRQLMAEIEPNESERPHPVAIAKTYRRCVFRVAEWQNLLRLDEQHARRSAAANGASASQYKAIYKLWPDFPVKHQTDRSISTIKADAAFKSFDAAGEGIAWAVVDSGVLSTHPHFGEGLDHSLHAPTVTDLHRCFVDVLEQNGKLTKHVALPDPDEADLSEEERRKRLDLHRSWALRDDFGHGTHVAGIIAGQAPRDGNAAIKALQRVDRVDDSGSLQVGDYEPRARIDATRLRGVAPRCRVVSLRVLDENGGGRSSDVIRALEYIREKLNDNPKLMRVHGVNLSLGYEFDAEMFACGQSPLCSEVNRLVQSGVVVVVAAGNTGYGNVATTQRTSKVYLSNTINDPGNAEHAITVGATHRDSPHTFGISYFSSKGPTGDGRLKPDLVAPGERITSCAAGRHEQKARLKFGDQNGDRSAYYIEDSGTSMAAPHVSGAIAAFLSIRQEFVGRPADVKRIFVGAATPLGRERYFEGHGLLDLMRAIQAV